MNKRWIIKTPNPQLQSELSDGLDIHPIITQLLVNRDITTKQEAEDFLNAGLAQVHDPFLLKGMREAVDRIKEAKIQNQRILIFGDYDVDGVTSSAILKNIFDQMGIDAVNYIPHRMHEGYGLNHEIINFAKKEKISLLITVDCGITSIAETAALQNAGIDVIIIDHHEPSSEGIPSAFSIVNPKQKDCSYPFKGLAAVGLVAKLAQALLGRIPEEFLDLVAIGTIADVARLRGENRIFVKEGLLRISKTKNLGLQALLKVAKIKGKKFRPYFVGFILGPRINATGRMGSANDSLELLLAKDKARAEELAESLEQHNQSRQRMQSRIAQEAVNLVESTVNFKDQQVIVLHKEGWHKGVLGIVASKIVEKYYRPTIVLSVEDGRAMGSARSINGFHIYDAIKSCSDHLDEYGGHKMAAGLKLKEEKISDFCEAINNFAKDVMTIENFTPSLTIDAEVPLQELDLNFVDIVDQLEPFGEGNPSPLFCSRNLMVKSPPVVLGKDTLKFWVTDGRIVLSAVGFGMGKYREMISLGSKVDLAYSLSIDDWNKDPVVQLKLKDIRPVL